MEQKLATFQIQDMLPIGLTIVVLGIGLGYGLNVMGDVKEDMALCENDSAFLSYNGTSSRCEDSHGNFSIHNGTAEFNATGDAILGVAKLPAKLPLIVTVIVAAIIIGILVRYLMVRYN